MMRGKVTRVRADLSGLQKAVESYSIDNGKFPQYRSNDWKSDLYPLYIKQLIESGEYTYGQALKLRDPFYDEGLGYAPRYQFYRYFTAKMGSLGNNSQGDPVPPFDSYVVFSLGPDSEEESTWSARCAEPTGGSLAPWRSRAWS